MVLGRRLLLLPMIVSSLGTENGEDEPVGASRLANINSSKSLGREKSANGSRDGDEELLESELVSPMESSLNQGMSKYDRGGDVP